MGWFGMPVSAVTASPSAAQALASTESRACGAPVSEGDSARDEENAHVS